MDNLASVGSLIAKINIYILNPIIILGFVVATVVFFYGIAKFLWSADNETNRAEGKKSIIYGIVGLFVMFSVFGIIRFILATFLAAIVFVSFLILMQSLAFWFGMISNLTSLMVNAMITFGIYPTTLFDSYAKLILFTLIPAALIGAVPAEFITEFSWISLAKLFAGAVIFLLLSITVFYTGLKRYESGSAIQVEV